MLNALVDTAMDADHLDLVVEGAFRYEDALGYVSTAAFSTVPEPASVLLVMFGLAALRGRRATIRR